MARSRKKLPPIGTPLIGEQCDIEAAIAAATVNRGWTAHAWVRRLEQMADLCAERHPERSSDLRRWATAVRARQPVTPTSRTAR